MGVQEIASVTSKPQPLPGQKNRSSEDFQFTALPDPSTTVTGQVSKENPNYSTIDASIMHDQRLRNDEIVGQIADGKVVITQTLELGAKYYIASPANAANQDFAVIFYGDIRD